MLDNPIIIAIEIDLIGETMQYTIILSSHTLVE